MVPRTSAFGLVEVGEVVPRALRTLKPKRAHTRIEILEWMV